MPIINNISELYKKANNSLGGYGPLLYDGVNLALYAAAPFTGGVTLVPAMAMTGAQGIGAAANAYEEGLNLENSLDMASTIPGFGITGKLTNRAMKPMMKAVGKTTKKVKYAPKYTPNTSGNKIKVNKYTYVGRQPKAGNRKPQKAYSQWKFNFTRTKEPLWKLAVEDKAYRPYASIVYGEDALNHGLNTSQVVKDINDLRNSKAYGGPIIHLEEL